MRVSMSEYLGQELVDLNRMVRKQDEEIEMLRLKAAKWKAYFFHEHELVDKLQKQIDENNDALIGEWDGFCYSSKRAWAKFRSLEMMRAEGLITDSEYRRCEYV